MGFLDKLTSGAKKLGEKLTSEETVDALKSGAAKATSGLASGLQKISDKLGESAPAGDVPAMTYTEIINILKDDNAGTAQWSAAYRAAAPLQLQSAFPTVYYLVEAMGIWRKVSNTPYNPYLAQYMQHANHEHDKLVMDETGLGDEASDLLWGVEEALPELVAAVYEMVQAIEDKQFLDYYYLAKAHFTGNGTDQDYRLGWLAMQVAIQLNEDEGEDKEINDTNLRGLWAMFNKGMETFNDALQVLADDNAGDDAWDKATDEILELNGMYNHRYTAGILMLHRGTIQEREGGSIMERATGGAFTAWYKEEPYFEHFINLMGFLAETLPDLFAEILANCERDIDKDEEFLIYAASAYIYGWATDVNLNKAWKYAETLSKFDDEGYQRMAAAMKKVINEK